MADDRLTHAPYRVSKNTKGIFALQVDHLARELPPLPLDAIIWPEGFVPGWTLDPVSLATERVENLAWDMRLKDPQDVPDLDVPDRIRATEIVDQLLFFQDAAGVPLVVGSVAIRGFKFVADVPKRLLMPAVLVLCIYGVFAVNNNIFDVGVMFAMGWVGYLMMRHRIPAAPFLIAFILGPLLEDNFRQSMLMSGSDPSILVRGPITWFFWTLTLITVFAITRSTLRKRVPLS